jgi:hypothetical protein
MEVNQIPIEIEGYTYKNNKEIMSSYNLKKHPKLELTKTHLEEGMNTSME